MMLARFLVFFCSPIWAVLFDPSPIDPHARPYWTSRVVIVAHDGNDVVIGMDISFRTGVP